MRRRRKDGKAVGRRKVESKNGKVVRRRTDWTAVGWRKVKIKMEK